jgi:hypothetical protein
MTKTEKEVKLDKIVLSIDGTKIPLSVEQAKKLKEVLSDLFGKEIIKEIHHNSWWYRPFWSQGTITYLNASTGSTDESLNYVNCCTNGTLELSC